MFQYFMNLEWKYFAFYRLCIYDNEGQHMIAGHSEVNCITNYVSYTDCVYIYRSKKPKSLMHTLHLGKSVKMYLPMSVYDYGHSSYYKSLCSL